MAKPNPLRVIYLMVFLRMRWTPLGNRPGQWGFTKQQFDCFGTIQILIPFMKSKGWVWQF